MSAALLAYAQAALALTLAGAAAAVAVRAGGRVMAAAPARWHAALLVLLAASCCAPLAGRVAHASGLDRAWASFQGADARALPGDPPSGAHAASSTPSRAAAPPASALARAARALPPAPWTAMLAAALGVAMTLRATRLAHASRRLHREVRALPVVHARGRVAVRACDVAREPFAWALGRDAAIVVPTAWLVDAVRVRMAVAHEARHLRARHPCCAWLLAALDVLFPFGLAAAGWRRALGELEEIDCDARVARRRAFGARAYADCLAWAAARGASRTTWPTPVTPMAAAPAAQLRRRIDMLVRAPRPSATRSLALGSVLLAGTTAATLAAAGLVTDRRADLAAIRHAAASTPVDGIAVTLDPAVLAALERRVAVPEGRLRTREALERMRDHAPVIADVLAQRGLPQELAAVVLVESGFRVGVWPQGRELEKRSAGLWQFIPSTARRYGLAVDASRDERLEPRRSTEAAAALLADLHARYGEWPLAFAAYNHGHVAVDAAIAEGGTRDVFELERRGLLEDYASRVLAAVLVLRDPGLAAE